MSTVNVLSGEVSVVFGHRILLYTKALCHGHYDYLDHLSDSLLLRIINYLELEDVEQLGQTSHRFRQVGLWKYFTSNSNCMGIQLIATCFFCPPPPRSPLFSYVGRSSFGNRQCESAATQFQMKWPPWLWRWAGAASFLPASCSCRS